ncbi:hypothetical protein A2348_04400 [Candidatus Uhrbacteria bacterium RIFOXYB12_FULL_58_10]|uniref:Uncharacterized protein n=1 Tax=Candidatus Uhrbacteria bacterium RIFOXYB2_FULL_57_15 TaxID=1802422 RepID=A0A1F7W7K6_9BACT|nr:MAG: hypothetical protein A2348_04400 [Candidatus Uhrbacteria bacterium RIFOXYB12_FULL_58_10]OGL98759.1 MAG: hypothetical protein A2304_01100 [Candidatus Uhrbacteria bacterium RIFOXYB2_FULL_57_15]OGL99964.1 MAG: hypothetical protein A2501_04430 [Candidatus Uhrbacteria bacterium RIFOXYC12_FULL_57_11]
MIAGPLPTDARTLMLHLGYTEHQTAGMGLTFVRSAHEAAFPRFHASIAETPEGGFVMNVHLDQAAFNGDGNHQYVWAYKNPQLDEETKRVCLAVDNLKRRLATGEPIEFSPREEIKSERIGIIAKFFQLM